MKHLTYTGFDAGKLLCGRARVSGMECVHAALSNPEKSPLDYCQQCFAVWLAFGYEGEPLPEFPVTPELLEQFESDFPEDCKPMAKDDPAVIEFRRKLRALVKS